MKLLVVITCYRAAELTIDCLRSLEPQIRAIPGAAVGICENGTSAESVRTLQAAVETDGWRDWVSITPINPNRGFSGGNNVILRQALAGPDVPEYFLLLNADTIVQPRALELLLETIEARPDVGIVGPRLEWPEGDPQVSCFRFPSPLSEFLHAAGTGPLTRALSAHDLPIAPSTEPVEPDWLSFACALIRREVVQQVGLLDEGFYLYFDDPDYCRRTRAAGWNLLYCPQARVMHLVGRSNPVEELARARKRRPRYYYASRSRYFAKHHGTVGFWLANLMWTAGRGIALVREAAGHKDPHTCAMQWRDIWTNAFQPVAASEPHAVA